MDQTIYEVREENGIVGVCVTLSGRILDRPVTVTVSTEDITATGMSKVQHSYNMK